MWWAWITDQSRTAGKNYNDLPHEKMGSHLLHDRAVLVPSGSLLILFFVLISIRRLLNATNRTCFIIEPRWMKPPDLYPCLSAALDCNAASMPAVVEACRWKRKSKLCGLMLPFCAEVCRSSSPKHTHLACCSCLLLSHFIEVSRSRSSPSTNNTTISRRLLNFAQQCVD